MWLLEKITFPEYDKFTNNIKSYLLQGTEFMEW